MNAVQRLRAAGSVFAEQEAALLEAEAADRRAFTRMLRRRLAGEPLEVIVGWALFAGRRLAVGPGVFVPRPRTEFLAAVAASLVRPGDHMLDLCCGVGAITTFVEQRVDDLRRYATDIDPVAVECARRNLPDAAVFCGDLFGPLPGGVRFNLIVANAPYVPSDELGLMPREARLFERAAALDGGDDGLDVHRRIAGEAPNWLRPAGWLAIEVSERQVPTAMSVLTAARLAATSISDPELDAHVVLGRRGSR